MYLNQKYAESDCNSEFTEEDACDKVSNFHCL